MNKFSAVAIFYLLINTEMLSNTRDMPLFPLSISSHFRNYNVFPQVEPVKKVNNGFSFFRKEEINKDTFELNNIYELLRFAILDGKKYESVRSFLQLNLGIFSSIRQNNMRNPEFKFKFSDLQQQLKQKVQEDLRTIESIR